MDENLRKNLNLCKKNSDTCKNICKWEYNYDSNQLEYKNYIGNCPYQSWMKEDYYKHNCFGKKEDDCKDTCKWSSNNCIPTEYNKNISNDNLSTKNATINEIKNYVKNTEGLDDIDIEILKKKIRNFDGLKFPPIDFDELESDIVKENTSDIDKNMNNDNKNIAKKDINMNVWDIYGKDTIFSSFQNNLEFKRCIDDKMTEKSNKYYKKNEYDDFMKRIENSNDNYLNKMNEDDIDMIVNICKSFEELTPTDIMDCLEKIDIDVKLREKICDGSITLQSVDVLLIILTFFGIHINSDNVNDKNVEKVERLVVRITPYVQRILRKILDMAEYIESNHCDGNISNTTRILEKFYDTLFHTRDPISYPFSDYSIKYDWFDMFNKNIYTKIILLVFVAFLFAQIVKLFTMKGEALQK